MDVSLLVSDGVRLCQMVGLNWLGYQIPIITDRKMIMDVINDANWSILVFPMMGFVWVWVDWVIKEECCQKCRKWLFGTWEPVPSGEELGSTLKTFEKLKICTQEPVPAWEEPGSTLIFPEKWNFIFWEPVPYLEEPGSPYIFPGAWYFEIVGTGYSQGGTGFHWSILKIFKTSKIHNFQTVSPFWAPFWTLFPKFNALPYKMKIF